MKCSHQSWLLMSKLRFMQITVQLLRYTNASILFVSWPEITVAHAHLLIHSDGIFKILFILRTIGVLKINHVYSSASAFSKLYLS